MQNIFIKHKKQRIFEAEKHQNTLKLGWNNPCVYNGPDKKFHREGG